MISLPNGHTFIRAAQGFASELLEDQQGVGSVPQGLLVMVSGSWPMMAADLWNSE